MKSPVLDPDRALRQEALDLVCVQLEAIERESGARAISVAVHDTATGARAAYQGDRWFHAASTIKIAILLGVYAGIAEGRWPAQARLHVRNRFYSVADGSPYRVSSDRDANGVVHESIGKMMRINELAHHMITTSSNLATNLLLDVVGVGPAQQVLARHGIEGVDLRRGVEDEPAFTAGINNRATANGLVALLRLIAEERALDRALSHDMLNILHQQEFRKGIPARLPRDVRVAHKTGEISTIAHDAGIVYAPVRAPYVVAILTEWEPETGSRSKTIARVSHDIYAALTGDTDA